MTSLQGDEVAPNSIGLVWLLAAVALLAPAVVAWAWVHRHDVVRRRWLAAPLVGLVLLAQVSAVAAVGVAVNRRLDYYPTWSALMGEDPAQQVGAAPQVTGFDDSSATTTTAPPALAQRPTAPPTQPPANVLLSGAIHPGTRSRTLAVPYHGPTSGLTGNIFVWLPPQYDDPAYRGKTFPVLLAMPGLGMPDAYYWNTALAAAPTLDRKVGDGSSAPFVVVMPSVRFAGHPDPECIDSPTGAKAWSWASKDVPAYIKKNFRVSPRPRDWSAYGFSLGAYCAAKLHIKHPEILGSASALSGDLEASPLWGGDPAVARAIEADPEAAEPLEPLISKAKPGTVKLLLGATRSKDVPETEGFVAAAARYGHQGGVTSWNLGEAGHDPVIWGQFFPKFLDWTTQLMRGTPAPTKD